MVKDAMDKNLRYAQALARLDELIGMIENEDIDVDELALQVKEAVELLRVCKAKIDKAEMEVKKVVDDFTKESKDNG